MLGQDGSCVDQKNPVKPTQQKQRDVPSLFSLSFMALGRVLDQFVHAGYGDLINSFVPSDLRASVLAFVRRRGLLDDAVLHCLIDDSWTSLDLSRPQIVTSRSPWLTGQGIVKAVAKMPHLEALDVSGCDCMDPDSLRALARVCPKLRLLRLGGSIKASKAAAEALPDIVPPSVLATDRQAASWEDTFSDIADQQAASPSYMPQLKYIVWPAMPPETRRAIEQLCCDTLVLVNPDPRAPASTKASPLTRAAAAMAAQQELQRGPSPLDPAVPLDEPLAGCVPPAMWDETPSTAPGKCETPYAREQRRLERRAVRKAVDGEWEHRRTPTSSKYPLSRAFYPVSRAFTPTVPVFRQVATVAAAQGQAAVAQDEDEDTEEEIEHQPPIAERFQMAYREQAARLRRQGDKQQQVLEKRARGVPESPALRAVSQWLDSY